MDPGLVTKISCLEMRVSKMISSFRDAYSLQIGKCHAKRLAWTMFMQAELRLYGGVGASHQPDLLIAWGDTPDERTIECALNAGSTQATRSCDDLMQKLDKPDCTP